MSYEYFRYEVEIKGFFFSIKRKLVTCLSFMFGSIENRVFSTTVVL